MIFDPFQLNPTSVDVPVQATPPESGKRLVPQLPAQNEPSGTDVFNYFLNKAVTDNAPIYEYGVAEEKRYSNPYLQFNPNPLGGTDIEDIYGKFQGSGEQLWNALVKTGATAATSFVSSFSTFGDSIDAIRGGKPFDEDSVLGQTQGWLRELEDKYPNFYTQWERDHPYLSAITPTGAANFWGDKILKNVGFTAGSLASSILIDAGIELATGGAATPASFILAAGQIKRALAPLKNAFRSLSKVSALNKVDDLAGVARVGQGINNGLKSMNSAYNLKKGLQFAGTTYFAAQGEAMIEGYQTYYQTKADLYKQELDKGTLTPDKIGEIEEIAQEAANTTTALNIPIIMASNLLQFPTIFAGKNILKQFDSPFLEIVKKEGLTIVNNYSKKQAWLNTMKEFGKDFISEGGEEGYQYFVGDSVHDYYLDKFNGTASKSLANYLGSQLPSTVKDEQFWESFVVGGLAGGIMGGYGAVKSNLIGANEKANKAVQTLQPVLDRFNSTLKDYVHFAENVEFSEDENKVNQFQAAHKALYSLVHDSLKYGIYDNFQDSIEDLYDLPVEEYNKLFNTEFDEKGKIKQLSEIKAESERVKNDVTEVAKFFQKNPFDSTYVRQRMKDIFKIEKEEDVKNVMSKLFDDYKELVGYNVSRLRNTNAQISNIEDELKMQGFEDSIIPILYNLASEEGRNQYKRLKVIQLNAIKDEIKYYDDLEQPEPELKLKEKKLEQLLKDLDKKFDPDEFKRLILEQEIGSKQLKTETEILDKIEELKKSQDIATNTAEDLETQTNQPEQKVKEMVETVSKIVPPETVQTPALVLRPSKDKAKIMEVARKIKNSERLTDEELIILNEIGDDMDDYIDQLDEYDKSRIQPVTEAGFTEEEFEQVITPKPKEPTKPRPEGEFDITGLRKELMEFIDPGGWEFSDNPSITLVSIATGLLHRRISMTGTNYDKVVPEVPLDTLESLVDHKVISQKTADDFKASLNKNVQQQEFSNKEKDLLKLASLQKEMGEAFSGRSSATDLLTAISDFFTKHFGWNVEGILLSIERKRAEFYVDGLKFVLPEGSTAGVMGGSSYYAYFTPHEVIEAKYAEQERVEKSSSVKSEKETVNAQKELTKQVNKLKNKLVPVQEGGIYLIDGDNRNAYRIVDLALDTVVPLPLSLVDGKLSYDPTLTAGLIKKIVSGYLINDDYIKDTPIEQTISPVEEEDIFSQELLDYIDEIEPDTDVSLEQSNLDKFISGSKIDNTLKSIIDWRLGKGITIDC